MAAVPPSAVAPAVPAALAPALPATTAKPPPTTCVAPGEDCSVSHCCKYNGYQCYKKNEFWASCRKFCKPGTVDEGDESGDEWSCEKLGERNPFEVSCSW